MKLGVQHDPIIIAKDSKESSGYCLLGKILNDLKDFNNSLERRVMNYCGVLQPSQCWDSDSSYL